MSVTVEQAFVALKALDAAEEDGRKAHDNAFQRAFDIMEDFKDAASTPLADYVDYIACNTSSWLRSLPGSKTAELRPYKAAVMALRKCPEVSAALGKKLAAMENAVKRAMSNTGLQDEINRRSGGDDLDDRECDAADSERLRGAILAYCEASDNVAMSAMLKALWSGDAPLESPSVLERIMLTVIGDDQASASVFELLRA